MTLVFVNHVVIFDGTHIHKSEFPLNSQVHVFVGTFMEKVGRGDAWRMCVVFSYNGEGMEGAMGQCTWYRL